MEKWQSSRIYTGCTVNEFRTYTGNCCCIAHAGHLFYYARTAEIKHCTQLVKPRSHCPGFQSRRRYGVDTGVHRAHAVATPASTTLNRDTTCWTGVYRDVALVISFLKKTGTHRNATAAKQRRLIPGHHRRSSCINRITTGRNRSNPARAVSTVEIR